jgi:hypothetical protein
MDYKEKKLPTDTKHIGIDSRHRDMAKFPNASQYTVYFDNVFQNVVSVSLVFAVYEKTGTELYVNLHIEEMSPNLISNSNHVSGSFCQLPMTNALNTYDTSMYKCTKQFEKPLAKLSKLTIKFIKSTGELYNMREHFLKFEIACLKFVGKEWANNELFTNTISVMQLRTSSVRSLDNAIVSIKVPTVYDMDILKMAFKSACETLRSYNLTPSAFNKNYRELKEQFRQLASNLREASQD